MLRAKRDHQQQHYCIFPTRSQAPRLPKCNEKLMASRRAGCLGTSPSRFRRVTRRIFRLSKDYILLRRELCDKARPAAESPRELLRFMKTALVRVTLRGRENCYCSQSSFNLSSAFGKVWFIKSTKSSVVSKSTVTVVIPSFSSKV